MATGVSLFLLQGPNGVSECCIGPGHLFDPVFEGFQFLLQLFLTPLICGMTGINPSAIRALE